MKKQAKLLYAHQQKQLLPDGTFVMPHMFEINSIKDLTEESFGPILHVVRYKTNELDKVIEDINSMGYGLTFGIHSRINRKIKYIFDRVKVGNVYVNRNIIGAVVGVQPFGGRGLSGTGPKAGGPNYIRRFATEKVITVNTTAAGGNASLVCMDE
jgi:RHH-type proline utilization regulon transcriptional repressor/proline dehydrogenase/delta 1-pyrroline-5-carboxylate dehydrogenase